MPANFIINGGQQKVLERSVRSIYVAAGSGLISVNGDAKLLEAEDEFIAKGAANVTIASIDGISVNVVYADEPEDVLQSARKPARAGNASSPPAGSSKAKAKKK